MTTAGDGNLLFNSSSLYDAEFLPNPLLNWLASNFTSQNNSFVAFILKLYCMLQLKETDQSVGEEQKVKLRKEFVHFLKAS